MTLKNIFVTTLIAAIVAISFGAASVYANPSSIATTAQTATATTTLSYMTIGAATTTLVYDSYLNRPTTADSAIMLVQFTASSTASVLGISYEYTNGGPGLDCLGAPNTCDWYRDNTMISVNATTSQAFSVTVPNSYSWTFASSSQGGGNVAATNNRALKTLTIPTPARYVRAIFTATGTPSAIWAQIGPKKENN